MYDRIKQFCENHQADLEECYDFSQTENGKALYEKERQKEIAREVMSELGVGPRQMSRVTGLSYTQIYKGIKGTGF